MKIIKMFLFLSLCVSNLFGAILSISHTSGKIGSEDNQIVIALSNSEIIRDYPELEAEDITACLMFAADREHKLVMVNVA